MHDFDYDVMQKKSIARGAAHRKRGAKSKKCTLPHDNLTKKELKALSGEVKTYNIHQRLTWEQFKALPDDLAAEHIAYLVDNFGANQSAIGQALGVSHITVSRYLKEHGIQVKKRVFVDTVKWLSFMAGYPITPMGGTLLMSGDDIEPVEPEAPAPTVAEPDKAPASVAFMRGSLVLSGPKGAVLQRLFEVLPDNVAVNVEFTAEEACDQ